MYIRRKVYSVLTDDYGYERLFSTNDVLLDGYDERYFSDDYASGRDTGALIGGALGLGAAGGAGAYAKKNWEKWGKASDKAERERVKALKKEIEGLRDTSKVSKDMIEAAANAHEDVYRIMKDPNLSKAEKKRALSGLKAQAEREMTEMGHDAKKFEQIYDQYTKELKAGSNRQGAIEKLSKASREATDKGITSLNEKIQHGQGIKRQLLEEWRKLPKWAQAGLATGGILGATVGASKVGGAIGGAANRKR